jgi:hypothetical protein
VHTMRKARRVAKGAEGLQAAVCAAQRSACGVQSGGPEGWCMGT